MSKFDVVDFSVRRSEEVMLLLTLSVFGNLPLLKRPRYCQVATSHSQDSQPSFIKNENFLAWDFATALREGVTAEYLIFGRYARF